VGSENEGWELKSLFHKPMAVGYVGGPSTSTVCLDLRAESLDDALEYVVGLYNEIASTVASGGAPVQATRYANNDEPRPKEYFRIFR
jgi:hypothetical protein